MKQKAIALSLALLLGAGLSCDAPVRPATTGSINVILLSPANGLRLSVTAPGEASDVSPAPDGSVANVTLTGARVTVTGPTSKTITNTTASGGFFDLTVDLLSPGTYTVTVEGLVGSEVAHFGQTSSVTVTAGATSDATVTFATFQPTIPLSTVVDTTDVLHFTVSFTGVAGATGYIVAWSKNADMSGAQTKSLAATTTDIAVVDEGKYFVTVRAVNNVVTSGGVASAAKAVFVFQGVATVTVTPASPTIAYGASQQLTAVGKDADGVVVPNVTWLWVSSDQDIAVVNQSGLVLGRGPGQASITAVGKGMPGSTALTVNAPPASKLVFTAQPASGSSGQSLGTVKIAVQNVLGSTVTSDNTTQVTVTIGANPGAGSLSGAVTASVTAGVATFTNVSINKSGSGYTLTAAANALDGATSSTFNVSPGAAAQAIFGVQPPNGRAGDPLSPAVQVELQDVAGNLVTTARNAVTIAMGTNPGGATLAGTTTVNAVSGIATFSNLSINKSGTGYTLSATTAGLSGGGLRPARLSVCRLLEPHRSWRFQVH